MATLISSNNLECLIHDIALDNPDGLRHAEFVRKVLNSGYIHKGCTTVSTAVHQVIRQMCKEGVLVRSDDQSNGTREYAPACRVY